MNYQYFISVIKKYETERIKAFCGDNYSAVARIPKAFALLIQDIIGILERNLAYLCNADEGIVIAGLQPIVKMIHSFLPAALSRTIGENDDRHLCCTLEYLVLPRESLINVVQWNHTCSIIIDFTVGTVMDIYEYLTRLSQQVKQSGVVYGWLNRNMLAIAWQNAKLWNSSYTLTLPHVA